MTNNLSIPVAVPVESTYFVHLKYVKLDDAYYTAEQSCWTNKEHLIDIEYVLISVIQVLCVSNHSITSYI